MHPSPHLCLDFCYPRPNVRSRIQTRRPRCGWRDVRKYDHLRKLHLPHPPHFPHLPHFPHSPHTLTTRTRNISMSGQYLKSDNPELLFQYHLMSRSASFSPDGGGCHASFACSMVCDTGTDWLWFGWNRTRFVFYFWKLPLLDTD